LVVDDESVVRDIITAMAGRNGYRVLSAESGEAGLSLSRTYQGIIDLLISDLQMPNMNGIELAAQLVQERPAMKVLIISGSWDRPVPREFHYLSKPFTV